MRLCSLWPFPCLPRDNPPPPPPPDRPQNLTIGSVTHESVSLSWDDPVDDSITGYQILRRVRGDGPDFAPIADDTNSAATTYVDHSVTPETLYTYRVKAINPGGLSPQSGYANVDVPAVPVPAQPQNLTTGSVTHESVSLSWDGPGDDSITGYQILRRVRGDGPDFAPIADDTGSAATTYVDRSVTPETLYTYRVKAINPGGLSPQSGYANVDVPARPGANAYPDAITHADPDAVTYSHAHAITHAYADAGATGPAAESDHRQRHPRVGVAELGRPRRRLHHRLPNTAPGARPRAGLRGRRGRHRQRGHHLRRHFRSRGGTLHLPGEGHQPRRTQPPLKLRQRGRPRRPGPGPAPRTRSPSRSKWSRPTAAPANCRCR